MTTTTLATVKFFAANGLYGFAVPDDGGADIYIGSYAIEGGVALESGDRVELSGLVENQQRPGAMRAKSVRLVERADTK